jgi:D-psicose/D-tagatose/L-ribulose 3-epimerase
MNLAVSNLAWDKNENGIVFKELKNNGIENIEGVLTKIEEWPNLSDDVLKEFKTILDSENIKIPSIQSIFYGVKVENLHDTDSVITHVNQLIRCCNILDVKTMVLGSPTLRTLNNESTNVLIPTLKLLDEILVDNKMEMCLEPNAKIYGGHYFYTIEEIIKFLSNLNLKNIKTMIDTHNLVLENVDPCESLEKYYELIGHIHISEPNLGPLSDFDLHHKFSSKIKEMEYDKIVTLEMKKNDNLIDNVKNFSLIYNN